MKRWILALSLLIPNLAFAACGEQYVDGKGDCVAGLTADSGGTTTGEIVTLDGTGGIVTTRSGDTITIDGSAVASPPGGSNTQVQYNDGGSFGGDSYFDYNETSNRLSVFTTLGTETVTNGTFASNASGWTVPSGMAYSSSSVSKTSNGTGALTQAFGGYQQREYLLTYTLSGVTAGTVTPSVAGFTGTTQSAACDVANPCTERFVATATTQLAFTPSNTARFTIDNISIKPLKGTNTASNLNVGGFSIQGEWSNGSPGTTRGMTYNNDGSYSWIDYRFSGVLRGSSGVNSSGGMDFYASGGNYFAYYYGNSGLTSNTLFSYNYPTGFVHSSGYGAFSSGVNAGSSGANTSTLQSNGGTALKVKLITASQSLDNTATHWLCDASTATCTGTPSASCSSWSNQTDCEKWDAHGGCTWFTGNSCSAFDYEYGMGSCNGQAGCTAQTSSCSGPTDQSTCEAQDDSYGGNCTWANNPQDCSGLDESTCGTTSGCSVNYDYCYNYSDGGGDGTACGTVSGHGCTYDSGTGACSDGMGDAGWYNGCTGTYDSYSCTGDYYTGSCTGTYGAACQGTSTCAGINDSTNCGLETGCSWSTAINATLPQISTNPDRTYWIYNRSASGADVNILPYSGDTIDNTSSTVLSNYKDGVHLAPLRVTASCDGFNQGACTPSGCSVTYCTWSGSSCSGGASCTGVGDESTCNATFDYCAGSYVASSDWYIWSRT